jgi:AcrR family transcriptional regulator
MAGTPATEVNQSRREQRRLRHQHLSRSQFLDAGEEIFGRKGFHETTLKEIAELAEFSVGSVYSFFDSKDDLFRQIFVRRGDEFMPQLREVLRPGRSVPDAQLHELVDFQVGFFRSHPHFGRLYLKSSSAAMLSTDRDVDAVVAANFNEAMELQAALFGRGQEAGTFRRGDPVVLARLFSGIVAAFQATDPAIISDSPVDNEGFALAELHDLVLGAFVVST